MSDLISSLSLLSVHDFKLVDSSVARFAYYNRFKALVNVFCRSPSACTRSALVLWIEFGHVVGFITDSKFKKYLEVFSDGFQF